MASFPGNIPEDLPPEGLDIGFKYLIYLGLIYIILTALTSWFLTRRRPKPDYDDEYDDDEADSASFSDLEVGIGHTLTFDDTRDMLSSLKIEIAGAEASLAKLQSEKQFAEISEEGYKYLYERYTKHVSEISNKMNEMIQSNIQAVDGQVDEGIKIDQTISDEEMADIESDLQKQLLDLDSDDDFLRPKARAKTPIAEVYKKDPLAPPVSNKTVSKPDAPSPPNKTVSKSDAPSPPKATPAAKAAAPMPPPKASTSKPTPVEKKPTAITPPARPKAVDPMKPPSKKVEMPSPPKKTAPAPMAPPKADTKIPPPPSKSETPTATPLQRAATPSAQQPMKVESREGDEKIFAKSTSIAALRMDMLRELARLKKLISEDDR